jgi:hypothetical protein
VSLWWDVTCPLSADQEQANYVGQYLPKNNPYSNTYNLGWRNHPNFLWSNNQGQQRNSQQAAQPIQESKKSDLESLVMQLVTSQQQVTTQQQQILKTQEQCLCLFLLKEYKFFFFFFALCNRPYAIRSIADMGLRSNSFAFVRA